MISNFFSLDTNATICRLLFEMINYHDVLCMLSKVFVFGPESECLAFSESLKEEGVYGAQL